ncbi:cell wall hydrolase [Caldichromatium japonicum]|uniref:Cell wall hydrolase n=1 Tax=Caldichromatium japonicum TaxID=2699430 RepID=A0A6G7VF30_9GAMM|nr:cell wall hydrolase [Caldichromatium japonicum]QIK38476.1 cell wall hydrolase [Caldichromatium japonicum]
MRAFAASTLLACLPLWMTASHQDRGADKTAAPASPPLQPTADPELQCLALNIYHEARSEPELGQIAVAQVTLNRVQSPAFPGSICAVVKQGEPMPGRCQFSWWCDGRPDRPTEPIAWQQALAISKRVITDKVVDPTQGALYYHTTSVKPDWAGRFKRTTRIGRHLFYRPARS